MRNKILGIILILCLLFTISGCSSNKKSATKAKSKEKVSAKKNDKKETKKIVSCTGKIEEDGMDMTESFSIEFINNNAKTTTFDFTYKITEDDEELKKLFDSIDFENQAKSLFADMGIDSEKFNVKVDRVSDSEIKLSLSGDYLDLVDAFSKQVEDSEVYKKTDYESVYKYSIKPTADNDELKCETKEV